MCLDRAREIQRGKGGGSVLVVSCVRALMSFFVAARSLATPRREMAMGTSGTKPSIVSTYASQNDDDGSKDDGTEG